MGKSRKQRWNKYDGVEMDPKKLHKTGKVDTKQEQKVNKAIEKNLDSFYTVNKDKSQFGTQLKRKIEKEGKPSTYEEKMVEKLSKKIVKKVQKKKVGFFEENDDLWETEGKQVKPQLTKGLPAVNPSLIKPSTGESYNPSQ